MSSTTVPALAARPAVRLLAFLLGLAAVFAVAYLTGTQARTLLAPAPVHAERLDGLSATADGYTVRLQQTSLPAGRQHVVFTVTGPDGRAVADLQAVDGAPMHLIAVRHDLSGYQHHSPAAAGSAWSSELTLSPGPWHLVVDFQPAALSREVVLGLDLNVAGDYRPEPLPAASTEAVAAGLQVRRTGELTTDPDAQTTLVVTRDGQPVTDLPATPDRPAHAVLIRASDRGFVHLHAATPTSTGPQLTFAGGPAEPGTYVMFVELPAAAQPVVVPFTIEVVR